MGLRTRDSKTFQNADCSYTQEVGRYLHYEASPGHWEDVDLNFHPDGTDWVMDHHDLIVRVASSFVQITERASGKGIRWPIPLPAVVQGRTATFSGQGLTWTYTTTKAGLKLSATVSQRLGSKTFQFPYALLGGAGALSVDAEGDLVSDAFAVPRAIVVGADGREYRVGGWRLLSGSRAAFDFDDTALPLEAFPYVLDPTTTFNVAASGDDGYVEGAFSSNYPPLGGSDNHATAGDIVVSRSDEGPGGQAHSYRLGVGLVRWDTSSIPDNATVGQSPILRVYVESTHNADLRSLSADWYTAWPINSSDYTTTAQTSALWGGQITGHGSTDIRLDNGDGVSKTGYTGLRLHVTGGQPTGLNDFTFDSYDDTSRPEPQLLVTYTTPTPTITSASDSPEPVDVGNPLTFTMGWSDPGANVSALICKTNSVSAGTCPGGAWATGSLFSSSPSIATYTTSTSYLGKQNYYAFACDEANTCSSSLSGTFWVNPPGNAAPSITSASDSPDPVTAGNPINFSVEWSDLNYGDTVRAVICKSDTVSAGTCPGGAWAIGSLSSSTPSSVSYTTTPSDVGSQGYYAFVCDAANTCSSSLSGAFMVSSANSPPTITSASDSPDPVLADSAIAFSVGWTDPGDMVRAVVCKTNAVSAGSCPGGAWGIGNLSSTSPSTATYTTSNADVGTKSYYAFACDASSVCSGESSGTFVVQQHNPPAVISASDSPDPAVAGGGIDFDVSWTAPGAEVTALICKTNVVNAGACSGGSWSVGDSTSSSPSSATYDTTRADIGTQNYYAFACDALRACSSSIAGTFTVVDAQLPPNPDDWEANGSDPGSVSLQDHASFYPAWQNGNLAWGPADDAEASCDQLAQSSVTCDTAEIDPPAESNSYYVTPDIFTHKALAKRGRQERSGAVLSILDFGGICSATELTVFSSTSCTSVDDVARMAHWWLYGYAQNMNHWHGSVVIIALGTNNSVASNTAAMVESNATNMYAAIENHTYKYASRLNTWAQNQGHDLAFFVYGANDIEENFNGPAKTIPWVESWNRATSEPENHYFPMVNYGNLQQDCASSGCWNSADSFNWTPHQIWNVSFGDKRGETYAADAAMPQMYHANRAIWWRDLNRAAKDASFARIHFLGVLWGCKVEGADEGSAPHAYRDFAKATRQHPTYLTLIHPLSGAAC